MFEQISDAEYELMGRVTELEDEVMKNWAEINDSRAEKAKLEAEMKAKDDRIDELENMCLENELTIDSMKPKTNTFVLWMKKRGEGQERSGNQA